MQVGIVLIDTDNAQNSLGLHGHASCLNSLFDGGELKQEKKVRVDLRQDWRGSRNRKHSQFDMGQGKWRWLAL